MASRMTTLARVPKSVLNELRIMYPNMPDSQRINAVFCEWKAYNGAVKKAGKFIYGNMWK